MSSVPGPNPWVEPFPWDKKTPYWNVFKYLTTHQKNLPPHSKEFLEKRALYAETMRNSVSIGIFRGTLPNSDLFSLKSYTISAPCGGLAVGQYYVEETGRGCMRETDFDGLESYVGMTCYSQAKLNGVDQKHYKENLQRKAADDNSPDNCVINREQQMLRTPPNTPESEQVII